MKPEIKLAIEKFKVELNNFMIMYAPSNMTIGEAEDAMLSFVGKVNEVVFLKYKTETHRPEYDIPF